MPFSLILFQIVIIILVPTLSMVNLKMIDRIKDEVITDKRKIYIQSAINQLFLGMLALWAARSSNLQVVSLGDITPTAVIAGCIFIIVGITVGLVSMRYNSEELNPALDILTPITLSDKITWVFVNFVAAICEEVIFRVVLYALFVKTTGNPYIAAIICAAIFGVAHSIQGIVGIIITAIFGLGLQYIINLSNGILIASVTHFLYNMATTFIVLPKYKKD